MNTERVRFLVYDNFPRVHFTYMSVNQLEAMEEILSSHRTEIRELSERYVLISHESDPFYHNCSMFELVYDDVINSGERWHQLFYDKLVTDHGNELVDRLIVKDRELIRKKIIDTLNFAFDMVYKMPVIRIDITTCSPASSIPVIIYRTISEDFQLLDRNRELISGEEYYFISKKKENES